MEKLKKQLSEEQKKQISDRQIEQSRRQDNKQHCQKILDGINKFDGTTAERAIWELIQNARDLSKTAEVTFTLDKNKLTFRHKGAPFNYESFTSLIKQVSSASKEDENAAGQFGTGFITTHKFSRVVSITGSLELEKGYYAEIKDFKLDRSANDLQKLIDEMTQELSFTDHLLKEQLFSVPLPETEFVYNLDNERFPSAQQGITAAFKFIPYVMVIDKRVKSISIEDNVQNRQETFNRGKEVCIDPETNLYKVSIIYTNNQQNVYYLKSEDEKDTIILPLCNTEEAISLADIPRFFIFFPLIGTQDFGVNYIFHSERFYPEEPRNAIVLPEDNIDKKIKYEHNQEVFKQMREMLYAYLTKYSHCINNSRLLASANITFEKFKQDDTKYTFYQKLKQEFVEKFQDFPFISINNGRVSASERNRIGFLSEELCTFLREKGEEFIEVVYLYATRVSPLPVIEEVLEWSEIIRQWDTDKVKFVSINDIISQINEKKEDKKHLLNFLQFLKKSNQSHFFEEYALIPNREGQQRRAAELRNASDISNILYSRCKNLIPEETSTFVDDDFAALYNFVSYGREDLKKSINEFVNSEKKKNRPFEKTLNYLLDYCQIFPKESGNSTRNRAMPYICEFFSHNEVTEVIVEPLTGVDMDKEQNLYRTAFDVLVEYTLQCIEKNDSVWFSKHKDLHRNLLNKLCDKDRPTIYQKEMFSKYSIIPNKKGEFCILKDLRELENRDYIPQEIQDCLLCFYHDVLCASYEEKLIDYDYAEMIETEKVSAKTIAREIEDKLKEENFQNPITIKLIELIDKEENSSQKYWTNWFEYISANKATIFLDRLQGEERDHTYRFMKANSSTQKKITELLEHSDVVDYILEKVKREIEAEREKELDFKYKYLVGIEIEKFLREQLQDELEVLSLNQSEQIAANDEQNGQDIVIRYNGEAIYYIEVKSKWNFHNAAHMSVTQMKKAVSNPERYALCCVELTEYSHIINEAIAKNKLRNLLSSEEVKIFSNIYTHLDIGKKLGFYLDKIVKDENESNDDTRVKITDYRSDLTKNFFLSGEKGLSSLIEAIRKAKEQAQERE